MILDRRPLMTAVSLLALGMAAMPAFAQDAATGAGNAPVTASQPAPDPGSASNAIVVTGVRASLQSAQSIKRQASQIVDSIVAEDIGKLPDNTVSDALQRVTGVQVTRGEGEAGTVLIRGLPNTTTTLNGREAFTGTARGVALQDIPAELLAGVDVYKTSTPDMIEGGVAGVIDVRLHRPFDFKGFQIAGGGRGVYSDQSGKWGYIGSGLISNRWDTGIGEVGLMAAASYNRRRFEDNTAFDFVSTPTVGPDGNPIKTPPFINPADGNPIAIPNTVGGIYDDGDRQRTAFNVSAQWRPSPELEFYADGIYTRYRNEHSSAFFIGLPTAGQVNSITVYPGSDLANSIHTTNAFTLTSRQAFLDKTQTLQADVGGKWHSGNATISSEFVYDWSKIPDRNVIVDTSFNTPSLAINFDRNGTPNVTLGGVDVTDPSNFKLATLFDNHSLAISKQVAWRGDLQYDFDGGFLSNFKIGSRITHRRVTSQATLSVGLPAPGTIPLTSIPGLASLSPSDLVNGALGIDRFALSDQNVLLGDSDVIREAFGQPDGPRAYDPNLAFFDTEDSYSFYGQVGYRFDLGPVPVDGIAGVRVVNTVEQLQGNGANGHENYVNVLPSVNARAKLADKLQLRLAYGKTITRPDFAALNPLVAFAPSGNTGIGGQFFGTGSGGNPDLHPIKSTAYDVSLEYYPTHSTSITAAGFYRKLNGYIETFSEPEVNGVIPGTDRPAVYLVSRPRNTGDGYLGGAELAYQQFFDFLPGALSGLGAQLNGTYTVGKTPIPGGTGKQDIVNVSKYSYNVVAIYEKYGISTRLAYNWRSGWTDSYNAGGSQGSTVKVKPQGELDLSINYSPLDWLTLTFDSTNLLDRTYHDSFVDVTGNVITTPRDTRTYDRTFEFGARFKF